MVPTPAMTRADPEALALSLLLRQPLRGAYALRFFDYRHLLTGGRIGIGAMSSYRRLTNDPLPDVLPDGITVLTDGQALIFYNDAVSSRPRVNWTIAHELGHVFLRHRGRSREEEMQADRFAAALLLPEAVIRFLDCQAKRPLTPAEMTSYFGASLTACRRRRKEIDGKPASPPSPSEIRLVRKLFCEETAP